MKAGTTNPCCPISARPRTTNAAPTTYHGSGGPLRVSNQPYEWEIARSCWKPASRPGIPFNPDFNGAKQEGCGYYQTTTKDKRRWSTAAAYLQTAQNRPNLTIRTRAHATRVLFEGSRGHGRRIRTPRPEIAHAGREVIVSGGAYGSPQLLQLSGVGPAQHLTEMGIPVVRDVPGVGSNLQDHFNTYCTYRISRDLSLNALQYSLPHRLKAGAQYVFFRSGPMSGNGIYVGALVRSDKRLERPDLQFNISAWSTIDRTADGIISHPFPGFRSARCIWRRRAAARCGCAAAIRWRRRKSGSTSCGARTTCG